MQLAPSRRGGTSKVTTGKNKAELHRTYVMADLETLPTTASGHIKKKDATSWMQSLPDNDVEDVLNAFKSKPTTHSGSLMGTDVSSIRVSGDADFITKFAALMKPMLKFDASDTRLEIKLSQVKDNETGELTDNYALYLNVADRA